MGHEVKNYVHCEWIGPLLREFVEEIIVLAFSLPTVAVVAIVGGDDHDTAFVIIDRAIIDFLGIWNFPGIFCSGGNEGLAGKGVDDMRKAGDLGLFLQIEDAMENWVFQRQGDRFAVRENRF